MTTFADLGLSSSVLKAVNDLGYTTPTPVQEQAIPLVLDGHDIIAAAKTGTGKTAAFSLPTMSNLARNARPKSPRMLVVTPTRELASQIEEVCAQVGKHTRHRVTSVVGGVSLLPQIQRLAKGTDVLIATPGRLLDLMGQAAVDLGSVEVLVLDEADRMLDMGFLPSVTKIVNATPKTRQTLLFSATVDASIMRQVGSMLHDPQMVQIAVKGETADTVAQYTVEVPHTLKPALLIALLRDRGHKRVIVFARTRHRAESTCRKLKRAGFAAESIHSDRTQNQRKRALDNFAAGTTDILVATDVLARGIDVEEVSYVVNFDIPTQPEDYVHRIGRTGRAGSQGFAVSFISPENASDLKAIEKFIKKTIPPMEVPGFDLEEAAAEAAARATRAAAKHDPELAEAARELAKKTRKKEKARASAAEQAQSASKKSGKGGKAEQKQAAKPKPKLKFEEGEARAASEGSASTKRPKQAQNAKGGKGGSSKHGSARGGKGGAAQRQRQGGSSSRPKKAAGAGSAKRTPSRGGSDMRPGRAHRAAVAEQRRRSR